MQEVSSLEKIAKPTEKEVYEFISSLHADDIYSLIKRIKLPTCYKPNSFCCDRCPFIFFDGKMVFLHERPLNKILRNEISYANYPLLDILKKSNLEAISA